MSFTGRRLRAVPVLIAINVVVFIYQCLLAHPVLFSYVYGLSAPGVKAGHWSQFVTHAFLHGNAMHLLFNMVGLWFAGRIVERVLGTGRFLVLYFAAAVIGGIFQLAFSNGNIPLIGASGAVFGVLVAFTTLFPESQIVAILFFIPVRLKAKYLGWLVSGSSVFFLLSGLMPGVGNAAHLGGCVAGYLFVRLTGSRAASSQRPPSRPTLGSYKDNCTPGSV